MPVSYKITKTVQGIQALKQNLTRLLSGVFQAPTTFSLVAIPNVGPVVAMSNPKLLKVQTGPAIQDFPKAKVFFEFFKITFIDLNDIAKIYHENVVQLLNANSPETIFTPMADQYNNFYILPTQYFYDHQEDMVSLLNNEMVKLISQYLHNYERSLGLFEQIFQSLKKEMAVKIEDFDSCAFKNMSLLDFIKYEPTSAIDAFNYFFKTKKEYSPFVILSKNGKMFHLDREKNNETWGQYLIKIQDLFLAIEAESRKKHLKEGDYSGDKGLVGQIHQAYRKTMDELMRHACAFDKDEMTQAILNAEKMVKEYYQLVKQCAEEGFSKHSLTTLDIDDFQKHIDVLTEALKIKWDILSENRVTMSRLTIRSEGGKLTLQASTTLLFAEINKIFIETKAALNYLGGSNINTICANTKNSLAAYIAARDNDAYEQQQRAIVDAANSQAKKEKEKEKEKASSSSSSSSTVAPIVPLFKTPDTTASIFSTTDENIHYLGESMGVDIYLNFNPANFIDDVPDINVFSGESLFKIANQDGGSGTKRLSLDPPVNLYCQIHGEKLKLPITYEMKPHGSKERLLCVNLSCKGAVLVIPVIYSKNGLHGQGGDIGALQVSSKNKVHVLHLSEKQNYAQFLRLKQK